MAHPYRPAASESYEDQLSQDPFRAEDQEEELPSPKANFLDVSQHHHHVEQQGGLIGSTAKPSSTPSSSSAPASLVDNLPGAGAARSGLAAMLSFLSVDYYRPYFDVSTRAVGQRIKNALDPRSTDVFALPVYEPVAAAAAAVGDAEAQTTPPAAPPAAVAEFDLFGSVWISLTLVFLIGATSNLNAYLAAPVGSPMPSTDYTLLTFASTMVVSYTSVFATLLWLAAGWLGATKQPALFKLLGLYGYVLSWFVIACLVCTIPVSAVQWIAVIVAGALSGLVLARNLTEMFAFDAAAGTEATEGARLPASKQRVLLGVAMAAHLVFSLLLKLYFFQGAEVKV